MTTQSGTYEQWMKDVDAIVSSIVGLSVHDLADFPSRDYFEAGTPPREAARELLLEEGFDLDEVEA